MSEPELLRARLLALRDDALSQLVAGDGVDTGLLALAAHAGAVLAALETDPPPDAATADRAVLSEDGTVIRLTSYDGAERIAVVELEPRQALRLAAELLAAGLRRF